MNWFVAARWLIFLATAVGLYWMGDHNRNNAWLAKQAKVEREAHGKYEAEVKRGNDASGAFLVEHQEMQTNFQNLTEKFNGLSKRAPLVVLATPGADGICDNVVSAGRDAAEGQSGRDAADNILLTTGAVWMWNSALTGTDQPSGTCGSLDTTEAACAVPTALDLDDAWANHRANAQTCAEDRLAHQRLIDFLTLKNPK